ncbi:hypothetical protein [Halovivax gelatinilyticus]|uniref:hypothetical protein n=1 Tax=Halovivax gelatinilyticus TaxID=2961597 RepID=UPI0020CA5783|nr:hypothetical protein [Halovivax gelatinilyticus]
MHAVFESDRLFYYAVGLFTLAIFVVGLAIFAYVSPDGLGTRELVGFVVGYGLFVATYFLAMGIYRLVPA